MTRPKRTTNDQIASELRAVIDCVQDERLTWAEIEQIAYKWCIKDYDLYKQVAEKCKLIPSSLLLFALLFTEHPLVISPGRGLKGGFLWLQAQVLLAELNQEEVPPPPKMNYFHISQCGRNGKEWDGMGLSADATLIPQEAET